MGYNTLPKDVDISSTLDDGDGFGFSIALENTQLAVGVRDDDGAGNSGTDIGAAHLFTFTDDTFGGGTLVGTIGSGYNTLASDFDVANLADGDFFGTNVSIDGTRLAISANNDDGAGDIALGSGAVYLFSFSDNLFSSPTLESTIGVGYTGGKNIDLANLEAGDRMHGVSLDGNQLVLGVLGDQGANNSSGANTGAVYLLTFADNTFAGANLAGIIGHGYQATGGSASLDLSGLLDDTDGPEMGVSLDNNRLAVGVRQDDGPGVGGGNNFGAVHLFSFADSDFNGGVLEATLGKGYTGGKNVDVTALSNVDLFGQEVSLDGTRLAVGAIGDDGALDNLATVGAVYLFTFADNVFTGGSLAATIGADYTGGNNIDVTNLDADDIFGARVSLDGNRLAVGATRDAGAFDTANDAGAAYLFRFTDDMFSGGTLEATIGSGYSGPKDLDLGPTGLAVLDSTDTFGLLSLNGNRLAVGAGGDDGPTNTDPNSGVVYLFSFADSAFNGATLEGQIGKGYTGGKNFDVLDLENLDAFGADVSLDGVRLAASASRDGGFGNIGTDLGSVRLFTFTDTAFNGAVLEGTIGDGYQGAKDIDVNLDDTDFFLRMSLDGTQLAISANFDDGAGNATTDTGAVYLFTFDDLAFTGGEQVGTLGSGYQHASISLAPSLEAGDLSGFGVALDGTRLALGSVFDDGISNAANNTGAVYLFTFADSEFNGPLLEGIVGKGYTGGKNINVSLLDDGDEFGRNVSLDGNRMAVGAALDDGFGVGSVPDGPGAVHLFTFEDNGFDGGQLVGTIGSGYSGPKDINIGLDSTDRLGSGCYETTEDLH